MDGLETLRELKQRMPEVPVVMLSGHGQARTIVEAMRLGASDFLRKPFEVEELELAFQKALEKRALKAEVEQLRGRARTETEMLLLDGDNRKMKEVREIIEQVADTDITVLIRGESGTGKELVARSVFQLSNRRDRPFVKVNCAALPVGAARERALRLREGRVHRRAEAQAREVRVRQPRHDLPGRDQRDAPQPPGEAAPGAAGRRVLAARRRERRPRRHARSSRRRTAISRRRCRTARSARTSSTA